MTAYPPVSLLFLVPLALAQPSKFPQPSLLSASESLLQTTPIGRNGILHPATSGKEDLKLNPPPPPEGSFRVGGFKFVGDITVFTPEDLTQVLAEFTGNPITFTQLLQGADRITQLYADAGYLTSGAYLPEQNLGDCAQRDCTVNIQIVEGRLETINILGDEGLRDYVGSRLGVNMETALNVDRLQEALQLLQLDPLIENLLAELSPSPRPGLSVLTVEVTAAPSFTAQLVLDNSRNPSVGSFRRLGAIDYTNLLGLGDRVNLAYTNTDGSNQVEANYTLPLNSSNGTFGIRYRYADSEIIEEPFDELNIEVTSQDFDLTIRQPVMRSATSEVTRDLSVGLTASRRESDSFLDGDPFSLSLGADEDGRTRLSILRLFQEYIQRSRQNVFAARSQFNLGLDALDATIASDGPDGRFLAWRGQFLWLALLGEVTGTPSVGPTLLLRSDLQLTPDSLVPLEQFGFGGVSSVRGYRQDVRLTDNGVVVSAEAQLPLLRVAEVDGVLQVAPFLDVGVGWNNPDRATPDPNTLVGLGVGLQWQQGDDLRVRLDWGIPLVDVDGSDRTWQENGVYFSIEYSPSF